MDTIYRPADTDNDILRKILVQYGGFPRPGDFDATLYRKILTQLGGTFRPGDGASELLRKIALRVGANPTPGDTTNKLLYRIDQTNASSEDPKPGDYDNILLRKWLSPDTALIPTPGSTIEIIPKVNPPHTQAEVTINMTGANNLVGLWLAIRYGEFNHGKPNLSPNGILIGTVFVTSMPFTVTFSLPIPQPGTDRVCILIQKGPTQAAAINKSIKGSYQQCFAYPADYLVVDFGGPPAAPVATAATSLTETTFSANWNASATATSYRLDVATDIGFTSFVTGFNNLNVGNVLTQSVTGLTGGTTYYFRVRAVNGFGTSPSSNIITSLTVPAAVVATASSSITETDFDANWNAATGAASYRLDVSTANDFSSFVSGYNDLNVGNVTTAAVTGLTGGTTYYFRVRAVNASGTGANSNTITTLTVPAAPVATAASTIATTSFDANWNASTGASSYRLDVSTANDFSSFVTGFNDLNVGNVTTENVTGLTAGTTYYFRVRAVNATGTSANSNTITTLTVPAAPVATAATSVADTTFDANWNASTGASSYRLDVATDVGFTSFVSGFNDLNVGNVTTENVTGLTGGVTYYFRVRAVNASGTSANSNTITTQTYDAETLDWVSRVVGNGGTVSQTTKDAANAFIISIKGVSGLRAKILRLNLFAGGQFAAAQVPFIKDKGNLLDAPKTGPSGIAGSGSDWTYAETGATGGLKPLTSQAWLSTNFIASTDWTSDNDAGISVYASDSTTQAGVSLGGLQFTTSNQCYMLIAFNGLNTAYGNMWTTETGHADATRKGFYTLSRTASNLWTLYRNGASIGTEASPGGSRPNNTEIAVFAQGSSTGLNTGNFYTKLLAGYAMHLGFTSGDASSLNSAFQTFNTTLTRNV